MPASCVALRRYPQAVLCHLIVAKLGLRHDVLTSARRRRRQPCRSRLLGGQEVPSVAETRAEVRRRTLANFERRRRDTSALRVQLSHASRMRGGRGDVWATAAFAAPRVCARRTCRALRDHKLRHDAVRAPRGLVVVSSPSSMLALLRATASRSMCSAALTVRTSSEHKRYCSRASR